MIEIIIADDHPFIREGIKSFLEDEVDISLSDNAKDGHQLLSILQDNQPDLLVLDMDMPGESGLSFLKKIHGIYPQLPILILSVHSAKRFAVRALKAGAKGYLNKNHIPQELINAIRKIVTQSRPYVPSEVAEELALQLDSENAKLHEQLSDREFEVFCKLAQGMNVKSISKELSLAKDTIYTYRNRIMDKTGLETNVAMSRYAIENDIID